MLSINYTSVEKKKNQSKESLTLKTPEGEGKASGHNEKRKQSAILF